MEDNLTILNRLQQESVTLAPPLDMKGNHKGVSGKIGVVGGSFEYTGAPYFAGISALKVGADLVHVFCSNDAAIPIKCYSPELMVHPLLDENSLQDICSWLTKMDTVLIGCGLGRKLETLNLVEKIIVKLRELKKPLVLDADALYLITKKPHLLMCFESNVILTPNRMELARLLDISNPAAVIDDDIQKLFIKNKWDENITILVKGVNDEAFSTGTIKKVSYVDFGGSNRRCGGQGDILGGCLAVFLNWSLKKNVQENPAFIACYAACKLARLCSALAYQQKGRSMTAGDMIQQIHTAFDANFEISKIK